MMLLTEEEMKTKWCPMARVINRDLKESGYNRIWCGPSPGRATISTASMCLGSSCGVWRWEITPQGIEPKRGYCGMGMPQL